MDNLKIFKDKLEEIEIGITTQTYISSDDGDYLISLAKELIRVIEEQQEDVGLLVKKVDEHLDEKKELRKEIESLTTRFHKQADYIVNSDAKLEKVKKDTIATILAYVEKNHDAPEIEEYLWKWLDKGTEFK